MPIYKFKAVNSGGEEVSETREAADEFALAKDLKKDGYTLSDFKEAGEKKGKFSLSSVIIGGIPFSERMIFTRNLSVMIKSGLSITRALGILSKQTKNKKFEKILGQISTDISRGGNLSGALSKHPKVFPELYVAMVKSGEKSGKIDESLKLIAEQMEKDYTLRRKIRGAMFYPAIVVVAMVAIGILMLIYVVPTLVSTFKELGVELPTSTKFIIWLSNSLLANSIIILVAACVAVFALWLLLKQPLVKKVRDRIILRIPIVSSLIQKINSARTARTLSSLINSGVEIIEAINVTQEVVQNFSYKQVLKNAKQDIQKGMPISTSFKRAANVFPPMLGEMIAVGEETGQLSQMLLDLAVFYEEEVSQATKDMATVIEPVLMVVIGAAVGFFAISMIKPMYSMMGGL